MKKRQNSAPTWGAAMLLIGVAVTAAPAQANVSLPSVIGSHMVLQRNEPCPIWGWADPNEKVTVKFGGQAHSTMADADGNWMVRLRPMGASRKPRTLTVAGKNTVTAEDVLVGEVWLCSGQSNMEWTVSLSDNPQQEIANANNPLIRHIKIPHRPSVKPEKNVPSDGWKLTTPATVPDFTAVGYFFAREINKDLNVPVGLLGSNWGGTRIEPWVPPVGFEHTPALKDITSKLGSYPEMTYGKDPQNPLKTVASINFQTPLALYNGMIHPLVPYAIRGALWYQGESNNGEGMLYYEKMKALIDGWRTVWNKPEMPFLFVQLAPYHYGGDQTRLAEIWNAQRVSLDIPNTGMAVTTDIGNIKDIHPRNKQEVGRRLALWALANTYDRPVKEYSGPLFKSATVEGKKIRVRFDHASGGLMSRDGKPLSHFLIAGEDGKYVPAQAEIDGSTVVVSSSDVSKPVAVRFAWHEEAEPNLANKAGLPASPFRSGK
jgi:sialate O-acetylesterase